MGVVMKFIGKILLILGIMCVIGAVVFLFQRERPLMYSNNQSFQYDLYVIELNDAGKFYINDYLCRHGSTIDLWNGKYELYKSKLVLKDSDDSMLDSSIILCFEIKDNTLVFNKSESSNLDSLKWSIPDGSIFLPSDMFNHFK
jgi:hypothetical protein